MSEEVKLDIIKETQDALSKYIKKPPLTEKLLKKPPFRYLHDIVNAIIRETSFLDGLYTSEELDSNNVKDKESKIAFLDKLINAVKIATGKNITIRSAKIVAGLEVHKTLELLQLIGKAIDEKIDTTKIVAEYSKKLNEKSQISNKNENKQTKNKENILKDLTDAVEKKSILKSKESTSNTEENKKSRSSVIVKQKDIKKEQPDHNINVPEKSVKETKTKTSVAKTKISSKESTFNKTNTAQSKSNPVRKSSLKDNDNGIVNSPKRIQSVVKENKRESKEFISIQKNNNLEHGKLIDKKSNENVITNSSLNEEKNDSSKTNQNKDTTANVKNVSDSIAKEKEDTEKVDAVSNEHQKLSKAVAKKKDTIHIQRPGSARPGSRKLNHSDVTFKNSHQQNENLEKNTEEIKTKIPSSVKPRTEARPPSARPSAPRIKDRGEVLVQDEVNAPVNAVHVIEEGKQDQFSDDKDNFIVFESEQTSLRTNEIPSKINDVDQGQLVHQILKTQKELNESVINDVIHNKHLEIEWDAGRQREKDIAAKEIEKIRSSIQTLTSAANPLGRLFDFLQEDVDEMQRELQHWKNVNDKLNKQQTSELELGKISLQPLQKQLSEIENSIQEEYLQIANIKTTILNNDERLLKLVTNSNTKIKIK